MQASWFHGTTLVRTLCGLRDAQLSLCKCDLECPHSGQQMPVQYMWVSDSQHCNSGHSEKLLQPRGQSLSLTPYQSLFNAEQFCLHVPLFVGHTWQCSWVTQELCTRGSLLVRFWALYVMLKIELGSREYKPSALPPSLNNTFLKEMNQFNFYY